MWYSTFSSKHIFLRVTDENVSLDENIHYDPHIYSVEPGNSSFSISVCVLYLP